VSGVLMNTGLSQRQSEDQGIFKGFGNRQNAKKTLAVFPGSNALMHVEGKNC